MSTLEGLIAPPCIGDPNDLVSLVDRLRAESAGPFGGLNSNGLSKWPTDATAIALQAEALLRGEWRVFDHPMRLGESAPAWRVHPLSGVATALEHFSKIPFAGDELGGDLKYIWEINRHAELLRLAQAYHLSNDERFATRVCELIESWIADNPPYYGVNWASALEVSFRGIAWCWIWKLTSRSNAWTEDRAGKLLWILAQSARFIERYDSIQHSPNTHLTGEALGLLYIGTSFSMLSDAAKWAARGRDILLSEIPHQFLDDGFHYERSTGYHRYNLEFYLHALALAQSLGAKWAEPIKEPLRRALGVTLALRKPDGDWPVFGDEDGGVALRLWAGSARSQAPLLALGAALLNDPSLAVGCDAESASLAWWMGIRTYPPTQPTLTPSTEFKHAGYFVAHDCIDAVPWYCVVDAGPHGGDLTGHAHTDVGHVELSVGRESVFVDPGCAIYASDSHRRDWYRALRAHATLSVDDAELARPRGPFGWETIAPSPQVSIENSDRLWQCRVLYTISSIGISHERVVLLVRGVGLVIVDRVIGAGTHSVRWNWPLGKQLAPSDFASDSAAMPASGVRMFWSCNSEPTLDSLISSRRSRTYGHEELVNAISCQVTTSSWPVEMITIVCPVSSTRPLVSRVDGSTLVSFNAERILRLAPGRTPVLTDPDCSRERLRDGATSGAATYGEL
jgi:hypothetical protein